MVLSITAIIGALVLSFAVSSVDACERGLCWATDNRFAPTIGSKPRITWYHHWQDGPVPQMPSKDEYVPMYWGPSKRSQWNARVAEMHKKTPKHLMAFNEPDVPSQSGMSTGDAAWLYMDQIYPWAKKGVKLGSPAIVWDLNWMNGFLNDVNKRGGHVDFICLHWYGSWKDLAGFKKYIQTAHSRFGKTIWVTEVGITSASYPSQSQVKKFMMDAFSWLDTQSYVERAAWFGAFQTNKAPDYFATGLNGLLNPKGGMNDMAYWYSYSSHPDKRSLRSRHHLLARNATESANDNAVHCDPQCQARNKQIEEYESTLPTRDAIEA